MVHRNFKKKVDSAFKSTKLSVSYVCVVRTRSRTVNERSIEHVATFISFELSNDRRLTITLHTIFVLCIFIIFLTIFFVYFLSKAANITVEKSVLFPAWKLVSIIPVTRNRFHFHQIHILGVKSLIEIGAFIQRKYIDFFLHWIAEKIPHFFSRNIFESKRGILQPNNRSSFEPSAFFLRYFDQFTGVVNFYKQRKQLLFSHGHLIASFKYLSCLTKYIRIFD